MNGVKDQTPTAVFVDGTGRRRRVVAVIGAGLAAALLVALGLLVSGLFGMSPVHLPGLPNGAGAPARGRSPSAAAPEPSATRSRSVPSRLPTPSAAAPARTPTAGQASASATPHGRRPSQTPSHPGQSKRK